MLVAGYFAASPSHLWEPVPAMIEEPQAKVPDNGEWRSAFVSDGDTPLVHAASMVELPNGSVRTFWFAGSREGAADVAIHSSVFDPQSGTWSNEEPVITRQQIAEGWGRHVRKLGNVVPVLDDDGRMRLFVVAVSFGGWAGSRVVVMESFDQGKNWRFDGVLVTTPFLNISTLVKTAPIRYSDGTIGLPVYHEMAGKFGEILRLDKDNQILGKARIGHGRKAIQPLVLVDSPSHAVAFLRNENEPNNGFLYQSESHDGGWQWDELAYSSLENPSAALSGLAMAEGHWLIAANCNRIERDDLCIRETRDGGRSWQERWTFHDRERWRGEEMTEQQFSTLIHPELNSDVPPEDPSRLLDRARHNKCDGRLGCEFQYDYPYMIRTRSGDLHMVYTWNKTAIRHLWLKADSAAPNSNEEQNNDV